MEQATDGLRLAAYLSDNETGELIDLAFDLIEKHGRMTEALIALRQAAIKVEAHPDYKPLADTFNVLLDNVTRVRRDMT